MILLLLLGPTAMPFRTGWTSRDLFRIGVGGGCKSAIVESKDPMVLTGKHHATASVLKDLAISCARVCLTGTLTGLSQRDHRSGRSHRFGLEGMQSISFKGKGYSLVSRS